MSKVKSNTIPSTVKAIAAATGLTHAQCKAVLLALASEAVAGIRRDGAYTIHGVVQLKMKHTPARGERKGRNPATGEALTIAAKPASVRLTIKPVAAFKRSIATNAATDAASKDENIAPDTTVELDE